MTALWVILGWFGLAALATVCFALGGAIGYRRGMNDAPGRVRELEAERDGLRADLNRMLERSLSAP